MKRSQFLPRVVIALLLLFTLVPFITLLSAALQPASEAPRGLTWPSNPQWGNFVEAYQTADMTPLLVSSVFIVVGVVPISLVIAALAGYGLASLSIPGARWLLLVFIAGLTIPFESLITPLFFQMKSLGVLNTRFAVILALIGIFMPFGVFWMRSHFVSIPSEVSEAAKIDGAGPWQAFWRVHLPLARPAVASLGILLFLWTWNQFILALVLIEDPSMRTVAGALGAFQSQYETDVVLLAAVSVLIMTPTIIVFLLFQRQFSRALLEGAVKG
ncbi:carbohydrate ABC transporter permease [Candidatus Poriferisodalis sp.]|uniref:carbohydrate ABC transporter permease n=1 Tax=Candidatus Poriferisodalis sp. TaxID=3101277 RepID=UPI003B58E81F